MTDIDVLFKDVTFECGYRGPAVTPRPGWKLHLEVDRQLLYIFDEKGAEIRFLEPGVSSNVLPLHPIDLKKDGRMRFAQAFARRHSLDVSPEQHHRKTYEYYEFTLLRPGSEATRSCT